VLSNKLKRIKNIINTLTGNGFFYREGDCGFGEWGGDGWGF
jgi:hypothetical protein